MSAAKGQPTPPEPAVDPLLLAAADLRDTTAQLREELAAARAERRLFAEVVAERDRLIEHAHESQRAMLVLFDRLAQHTQPARPQLAAATNGSVNDH